MRVVKYIRLLLFPLALLYGLVIRIRNRMFDTGRLESKEFDLPIISVGNITVGGTGKTPLTEYIIKILTPDYKLALLSRGYKRKTSGVVLANKNSTALDIGDEPKQIKDKFNNIKVVVAEKRVEGINALLSLKDKPDVVVMDDAYQHRYVKPGLSILVMDFNRPLWKDFMLPAGELREPVKGKSRADIILVSKCPSELSSQGQINIINRLNINTDQSVYFTSIGYKKPISLFCNDFELDYKRLNKLDVLLVAGIANPKPLFQYVNNITNQVSELYFPDHYQFNNHDISKIKADYEKIESSNKIILTTEKDAVRLREVLNKEDSLSSQIWYVPIEIKILNNKQKEFKEKITTYVKQNKSYS